MVLGAFAICRKFFRTLPFSGSQTFTQPSGSVPSFTMFDGQVVQSGGSAFTAPPTTVVSGISYATCGNSRYNMLRGPGWQNWDVSLQKNTIWKERYRLQLHADSFKIFNHPSFAPPNAAISNTSTVGTISSVSSSPVAQAHPVEFAVKFNF
jgi:hypothetical protein